MKNANARPIGWLCAGTVLFAGAACSSDLRTASSEREVAPAAVPVPLAAAPATGDGAGAALPASEPIDLTGDGAIGVSSAEAEIIDTRTFTPQIQASFPWDGPVRRVKEVLPPHTRKSLKTPGEPNDLPVGGTMVAPRTTPAAKFPGISQTPWTPPDPTLAVGPDHIVETVNMAVAFYTKAGELQFSANLDETGNPGFFEDLGAGGFVFDPKCFYDHYADRFVIVALEVYDPNQSWIDIAISDDSDPNGVWYKYRTNSVVSVGSSTYWVDYPGFGYDETGYYVTGNLFGLNVGGFGGVLFRSFDKTPLLSGQTASIRDVRDGNGGSVQVAQHFGANNSPLFVSLQSSSALRVQSVRNPHTSPSISTTIVTVPPFSFPSNGAPSLGGGSVSPLDGRIMNVHWRDGNLFAAHSIDSGGRNLGRWYRLATGNWPESGSVTFAESGNLDAGPGKHTTYPAIYSNAAGDVGVVAAVSSASQYVDVSVAGRTLSDAPGSMGAFTQVVVGSSGLANFNRWGDYFDIALDPADDETFWVIGQYQDSGGWRTWISSFTVGCPPDFNGDGTLDVNDFTAFREAYLAGDMAADFDESGSLNVGDFTAFRSAYLAGCP